MFPATAYRNVFLTLLGEITTTCGIAIHAYCLMETHYHLLLCTPRGNLSEAMRHLNGVYTQRYNRRYQTDGPLFRGRFKAILVDADAYLAQLSRYIHLNPILAKIPDKAFDPHWSSYPAYLGQVPAPSWLHLGLTLGLFGAQGVRQHYRTFVESGVDEELQAFYTRKRLPPLLGGEDFRRRIAPLCEDKFGHPDIPDTKILQSQPVKERGLPLDLCR
jgi:REP element-mobilizing transposase RayT